MKPGLRVLVVSTKLDSSTDAVVASLLGKGCRCVRLNTEEFPFNAAMGFTIDEAGVDITFAGDNPASAGQGRYSAVWYRRVRVPEKPADMHPGIYDFCLRETRSALIGSILSLDGRVMSRPEYVWSAEYKPHQLAVARSVGFRIPATVITNDPGQIRAAFDRFGGRMVAKPVRTGFVDLGAEQRAIFTNVVSKEDLADLDSAKMSPAIFQQHIAKECDVRVTVVGQKIFVAEIDSQGDEAARIDWRRTSNPDLPHRRAELPAVLEGRILELMDRLGLNFGALDLIRTQDDEYYFLEVNPNGQWLWLDDLLGFDITGTVADWLMGDAA